MRRRPTNYTSTTTPVVIFGVVANNGDSCERRRRSSHRRSTLDRSEVDGDVRRQHLLLGRSKQQDDNNNNNQQQQQGGQFSEGSASGDRQTRRPLRQDEQEMLKQLRGLELREDRGKGRRQSQWAPEDPIEQMQKHRRRLLQEGQQEERGRWRHSSRSTPEEQQQQQLLQRRRSLRYQTQHEQELQRRSMEKHQYPRARRDPPSDHVRRSTGEDGKNVRRTSTTGETTVPVSHRRSGGEGWAMVRQSIAPVLVSGPRKSQRGGRSSSSTDVINGDGIWQYDNNDNATPQQQQQVAPPISNVRRGHSFSSSSLRSPAQKDNQDPPSSYCPSSPTYHHTPLNPVMGSPQSSTDDYPKGNSSHSSHDDEVDSSRISSESSERRRLEEYAGRRALQRLEKELEDHSEMSRSNRSNHGDRTNWNDSAKEGGKGGSWKVNVGNGGTGKNLEGLMTTQTHPSSSTNRKRHKNKSVMDRRKLARVPRVAKSDLIIGEYLGRGNFCDVFEVTWVLPANEKQKPSRWERQVSRSSAGASTKITTDDSASKQSLSVTSNRHHERSSFIDDSGLESSAETLFPLKYSNDLCFDPVLNATNLSANRRSVSQVWVEGMAALSTAASAAPGRGSSNVGVGGGSVRSSDSVLPALSLATWGGEVGGSGRNVGGVEPSSRCNPNALALKCLRPAVRAQPRKFIIGAEDLAHETAILACLDHPNIIQLHGRAEGCFSTAFQMRDNNGEKNGGGYASNGANVGEKDGGRQISNEGYFIILDRLEDTLTDRIDQWKDEICDIVSAAPTPQSSFSPDLSATSVDLTHPESTLCERLRERLKVAYSIADAFEYLHSCNIVFRDLKPANVGFDRNDCVKVFDFGFATSIAPLLSRPYNGYGPLTETCGTRRYMAPEVALKLGYGKEVDVYSFGMLLWELCALNKPFDTIQSVEEFHDIVVLYGKRPSLHVDLLWPRSLKALMSRCWSTDPLDRPTMIDVKSMLCNVLRDVNMAMDKIGSSNATKAGGGGHGGVQQGQNQGGNFINKWRRRVSL